MKTRCRLTDPCSIGGPFSGDFNHDLSLLVSVIAIWGIHLLAGKLGDRESVIRLEPDEFHPVTTVSICRDDVWHETYGIMLPFPYLTHGNRGLVTTLLYCFL